VLGLAAGRLFTPALAGLGASLLDAGTPVAAGTALPVLVLALLVASSSTAWPCVRAAWTATVPAMSAAARPIDRSAGLTALAGRLPVPPLLGLRLVDRRPSRAVLARPVVIAVATDRWAG
jgi:putative ABC transport system permease protein